MTSSRLSVVVGLVAMLIAPGVIPMVSAEPPGGLTAEVGPTELRLGFGVAPLTWSLVPAPGTAPGGQAGESERLLDLDSRGTAVSFDLRLAWPGAATSPLQPYVAVGPALFVIEPDYAGRLLGTRVDPTLHLGAKAGAGLSWRLGKNATMFGAYEMMAAPSGNLGSPGTRGPADTGIGAHDFTYGIRFLY